jgi:hypothetical protein
MTHSLTPFEREGLAVMKLFFRAVLPLAAASVFLLDIPQARAPQPGGWQMMPGAGCCLA